MSARPPVALALLLASFLLGVIVPAYGQIWHRTPVMPNLEFGRTAVDKFGHVWTASPGIGLCDIDTATNIAVVRFHTDRPITSIMTQDSLLMIVEERYDSAGAPEHRLFRSTDRGYTWIMVPMPDPVARPVRLFRDSTRALYLGCTHGLLLQQKGSEFGLDWSIYHRFEAHADDPHARVYPVSGVGIGHWATIVSAIPDLRRATNRLYRQVAPEEWIPIDVSGVTPNPVWEVHRHQVDQVYVSTAGFIPSATMLYSVDSGATWSVAYNSSRVYPQEHGAFLGAGDYVLCYSSDRGIACLSRRAGFGTGFIADWRIVDFYLDESGFEYFTIGQIDGGGHKRVFRTSLVNHKPAPYLKAPVPGPFIHPINDYPTTAIVPYGPQQWFAAQDGGGLWRTTNQGVAWENIADCPVDSIRHIVVFGSYLYLSAPEGIYRLFLGNRPRWEAVTTDRSIGKFTVDPSGVLFLEADSLGIVRYVPGQGFDSLAYYSPARAPDAELVTYDWYNRPVVRSNGLFHRLSVLGDFWTVMDAPLPADSVRTILFIDHRTQFMADCQSIWRTVDGGESWDQTTITEGTILSLSLASAIPFRPVDGDEVVQIVAATDRELWSSYDFGLHWTETSEDLPTTDAITSYAYDPYTGLHIVALDRAGIYWSERQRASGVATTGSPRSTEVLVDPNGIVQFVLDPGLVPTSVRAYDLLGRAIPGEVEVVSNSAGGVSSARVRGGDHRHSGRAH